MEHGTALETIECYYNYLSSYLLYLELLDRRVGGGIHLSNLVIWWEGFIIYIKFDTYL